MTKSITAALTTALAGTTVGLAVIATITRSDGRVIYLTAHDQDLVVAGDTYRHDIGFTISAVSTGSNLSADTCSMDVALDGVLFTEADIHNGVWRKAIVEISQVNWGDTSQGRLILRRGQIRQAELKKNGSLSFDIEGLLKVLDFGVGRTLKPVCDAELGDGRCKIAINPSQAYSIRNKYYLGDWVYWYDTLEMAAITGTNLDFSAGNVAVADPISGWTKSAGSKWIVNTAGTYIVTHPDGDRVLAGDTYTTAAPDESYIYQDLDISGLAANTVAGKTAIAVFVECAQPNNLASYARIRASVLDVDGLVVQSETTHWFTLDAADTWREKAVIFNCHPDGETVRVYLETRRLSGTVPRVNFANVRFYSWDIVADNPTHDFIFKMTSSGVPLTTVGAVNWLYPTNPGFEVDGVVNNVGGYGITGWPVYTGVFDVAANGSGSGQATPAYGNYAIFADGAAAAVGEFRQMVTLTDYAGFDTTKVDADLGVLTVQAAHLLFSQWSQSMMTLTTYKADGVTMTGSPQTTPWYDRSTETSPARKSLRINVPTLTRKVEIKFNFREEPAHGQPTTQNHNGIDNVQFYLDYDTVNPPMPTSAEIGSSGDPDTVPVYTLSAITSDGALTWKAHTAHVQYDTVASVTDTKTFVASTMTGDAGSYETTRLRWLSGDNAGTENIIRKWTSATQTVKLYFPQAHAIQAGDRFRYEQGCQKRFTDDCKVKFDNIINFRGFPYVPGNKDE